MIGPKCQKCGKQRKYHGYLRLSCPIGKRRKILPSGVYEFEEFHPTDRFEAKEKSTGGASERRKNRKVRRLIKAEPCIVCNEGPCDPCHIRGWGVSQCDEPWNITSLCRRHHNEQGRIGQYWMAVKYNRYALELAAKGWEFILNHDGTDWSMFNEKEVEMNRKRRAV